ncbi:hypothetical protein [Halioxenophilus aromaticivorans]|uniref:Uncharacterized protein n=1 Tax=Halioxenophilus aromaticivorans TaxID=1306992 RepID=A0AAV3TWZ6_9ALTE
MNINTEYLVINCNVCAANPFINYKGDEMKKLVFLSVLGSAVFMLSTAALAADWKTYPGSMGVKFKGPSPYINHSGIYNPSSTSVMYVDLPIINDDSNDIASSNVRVIDRHYSQDIRCSVNQRYMSTSSGSVYGYMGGNKLSSGSSAFLQKLNTGALGGSGSAVHSYFSCKIPPTYSGNRSGIFSYYVNEG